MLWNYILITLRNIRRRKFYSFINITGLSVGIASCILIGLYVADEFSFDRFHDRSDRIVRLTMKYKSGSDVNNIPVTGTKAGPYLKRNFPAVDKYTRMIRGGGIFSHDDLVFEEKKILFADSTFFEVFTFPLVKGDPSRVLDAPDRIILTRSMAKKYFGEYDPVGEILRLNDEKDFMVTGVAEDPPANSQIKFDFVIPFSHLGASKKEEWFTANYFTYLLLGEKANVRSTERQIDEHMREISTTEVGLSGGDYLTYRLEPLTRVHLYSEMDAMVPNGSITYIYLLAIIGLLILLIACINYTNLSIAQAAKRNKEIGMRKVLGAQRRHLFTYFITESTLMTVFSTILAIAISSVLIPLFNELTGKTLTPSELTSPGALILLLALCLIVGILSGAYPAAILSRFQLIRIFRTGSDLKVSSGNLGRTLIVVQFAISIFLIIAAVIIQQQRAYIQEKNLGYDKENVLILPNDRQVKPHYQELKEAVKQVPGVLNVSAGYDLPTFIRWTNSLNVTTEDGEKRFSSKAIPVDLDFLATLNIEIISGADFTQSDLKDLKASWEKGEYRTYYIVNESVLKELGWTAEEAVGRSIQCGMPGTIKAVVKNFHISSLHNSIPPLAIFLNDEFLNLIYVKIDGRNTPVTISRLENIWKERIGARPFDYHFLDDDYDRLYIVEQKMARFTGTFAILAIILACLGVFGLSAFMAVQRTREIGIRKVLGASVREVVLLLSKDFILLVLVACVIAVPLGWLAARKWLQGFAYHIDIQVWVFVVAGLLALVISVITVGFQSVRAALVNPVESLRSE